ncbi:fimbrial biogenesis chaperone [Proteus vulgaris]|uniref:fimbrial biogenesis chaperone n=1 Tax=Proteus vulgaris TaxID=585 RepID=UPI0034E51F70
MNLLRLSLSGLLIGVMSCPSLADGNNQQQVGQAGGVGLSATRVIYPLGSRSVTLRVDNPADYPFLVKSTVQDESLREKGPFIVTPPLFRLDSGQHNTLTITRTGGNYPNNRESMNWLCVQSVPPEADSVWVDGNEADAGRDKVSARIRLLPSSCIKLLVRPEAIQGQPVDVADNVSWHISGKTLTANNPTPFYMNISQLTFNGTKIQMGKRYIPPFSEERFPLSGNETKGTIKWTVIGDYGEEQEKTATVK